VLTCFWTAKDTYYLQIGLTCLPCCCCSYLRNNIQGLFYIQSNVIYLFWVALCLPIQCLNFRAFANNNNRVDIISVCFLLSICSSFLIGFDCILSMQVTHYYYFFFLEFPPPPEKQAESPIFLMLSANFS